MQTLVYFIKFIGLISRPHFLCQKTPKIEEKSNDITTE
jgi:hypothetical protein